MNDLNKEIERLVALRKKRSGKIGWQSNCAAIDTRIAVLEKAKALING